MRSLLLVKQLQLVYLLRIFAQTDTCGEIIEIRLNIRNVCIRELERNA